MEVKKCQFPVTLFPYVLLCCFVFVAVAETTQAFEMHFENQINLYDEQVIVNLINQSGRERVNIHLYIILVCVRG